jgi:hypothetical protein
VTTSMRWIKHIEDPEEKKNFQQRLNNSKEVFRVLTKLIEEDYAVSDRAIHDKDSFKLPAWSEKTAFELGTQKALRDILKLIKVD